MRQLCFTRYSSGRFEVWWNH